MKEPDATVQNDNLFELKKVRSLLFEFFVSDTFEQRDISLATLIGQISRQAV